jgi:pimeloyl-ACP methyl ester carboxylesterase
MSPLAKANIPAPLIAADTSPNAPDLAKLAKRLPKAETVRIVPGAGHAVFIDRPQAFNGLLDAFLKRLQD